MRPESSEPVEPKKKPAVENFLPAETVDRVEDLFIVREFDGPTVEKRLGIRRTLFERALRHAINRHRDPSGPKSMQRAGSSTGRLAQLSQRRTA